MFSGFSDDKTSPPWHKSVFNNNDDDDYDIVVGLRREADDEINIDVIDVVADDCHHKDCLLLLLSLLSRSFLLLGLLFLWFFVFFFFSFFRVHFISVISILFLYISLSTSCRQQPELLCWTFVCTNDSSRARACVKHFQLIHSKHLYK